MRIGKSQRGRPWGRIESLERREMMTLEPTFLGEFQLCQPESARVDVRGETSYYLAADTSGYGCSLRSEYDWVIRTDLTTEGTVIVGRDVGEQLNLDSFFVFDETVYFDVSTGGASSQSFFATDGTENSAVQLASALGSAPVEMNGELLFTSDWGRYLWSTDGTARTQIQGFEGDQVGLLLPYGDEVVFSSYNGDLWTSDGTPDGTRRLTTIEHVALDGRAHQRKILSLPHRWRTNDHGIWMPERGQFLFGEIARNRDDVSDPVVAFSWAMVEPESGEIQEQQRLVFDAEYYLFSPLDDRSQAILSIPDMDRTQPDALFTDWYTDWTVEGTYEVRASQRLQHEASPVTQGVWRGGTMYAHFDEQDSEVLLEISRDGYRELLRTDNAILSINVLPGDQSMLVETGPRSETTLWHIDVSGPREIAQYRSRSSQRLQLEEWQGSSIFHVGDMLWQTDGTADGTVVIDEAAEIIHFTDHAIYYRKSDEIWRAAGGASTPERVIEGVPQLSVSTDGFLILGSDEQLILNAQLKSPAPVLDYLGIELGEVILELSNGQSLIFENQRERDWSHGVLAYRRNPNGNLSDWCCVPTPGVSRIGSFLWLPKAIHGSGRPSTIFHQYVQRRQYMGDEPPS